MLKWAKLAIRRLGFDVVRWRPPQAQLTSIEIQASLFPDARVIFDVGAYVGEPIPITP
jgi:hypothetical protein